MITFSFNGEALFCPNRPLGDSSNACASTEFVQNAVGSIAGGSVVGPGSSVVGQLALWANTSGTLLSASSTLPNGTLATTQSSSDNTTKVATTAYVMTVVASYLPLAGGIMTGNLNINATSPGIALNKATSGHSNLLVGYTNMSVRWVIQPGNDTAESGANAGSDFTISRYSDAGSLIDAPFTINRATGLVTIPTISSNSVSSALSLKSFGVVANGVTSDLAAFNKAIAYANDNGGNMTFRVPQGITLLDGAPTAIIVNNVFFIGDGAAQNCIIKTTNNLGLSWSTTSSIVDGGGMLNVGLDSDAGTNRVCITMPWANRMRFDHVFLKNGVSVLAAIGDPALVRAASQIEFNGLRGIVADTAGGGLIQAFNGSGLLVYAADLFVNVATYSQTAGRSVVQVTNGSWDSLTMMGCLLQNFYSPLVAICEAGKVFANFLLSGNWMDTMLYGPVLTCNATGLIYAAKIFDNEITAHSGVGIFVQGAGSHEGYQFSDNQILLCLGGGISLPATAKAFTITGNSIFGITGATANGITIASGANGGVVANNIVALPTLTLVSDVPKYGIQTGNVSNVIISGNIFNGTTAGGNFGTLTNTRLIGNMGYTSGTPDASCNDQP